MSLSDSPFRPETPKLEAPKRNTCLGQDIVPIWTKELTDQKSPDSSMAHEMQEKQPENLVTESESSDEIGQIIEDWAKDNDALLKELAAQPRKSSTFRAMRATGEQAPDRARRRPRRKKPW